MPVSRDLRDWYLSTLGVVQYRPRDSEPVALDFHPDTVAEVANTVPSEVVVALPENSELPGAEDKPADLHEEQIGSFRLACWQPSDDLLVINGLAPGSVPLQEESGLLANIMWAIGRLGDGLSSPQLIDWPPSAADQTDRSGAEEMLSVFVEARVKKQGVLWVLLMGELPAALLLPSKSAYPSSVGRMEELPGGARAIVTPSLQELLNAAELKGDTWRAIRVMSPQP
ncbi:hypothetical protein [uncultured Porticoccus sp.]|uniref:hypothetical protein n=1 Tax=uncultured Porticoccus sp. TaxID=1256050 RepID=UPI0026211D62|nr:hypothetical protein [uncultured Porticoccus sp.]